MLICGLDEVGRGSLAGPLIAVAALFRTSEISSGIWDILNSPIPEVDDSKKLTNKKKKKIFHEILRHRDLVDFGIGEVSVAEINDNGIVWANEIAFQRAVRDLHTVPDYILVDGTNPVLGWDTRAQRYEPKADGRWWPVAAASILAKVIRDNYMAELAREYPDYKWESNAGYGSAAHKKALKDKGACRLHRTKFVEGLI